MVVLVTGANGQLGQSIQFIADQYPEIEFFFYSSTALNITKKEEIDAIFIEIKPDFCINAAAYTAVDKAESELEKAHLVNVNGPENLALICKEYNVVLLHISTDFVFDGNTSKPYTEEDLPNPKGIYGRTKLEGEKMVQAIWKKHFIIRTSWVYSQFGNNFMKTMLRLGAERESLSIVNDQIGTPTHAVDLAQALILIIKTSQQNLTSNIYGIYNFSNEGQCSWYDFAKKIFEINNIAIEVLPIPTTMYPTSAKRPTYSVLNKSKISFFLNLNIKNWQDRLLMTNNIKN